MSGIRPRKKVENEDKKQNLLRRLEEYAEYAYATKRFSNAGFYKELLEYIEVH